MDQISGFNVKGVAHNDGPRENYHLTVQLASALQSFTAFLRSFFFSSLQLLLIWFILTCLIGAVCGHSRKLFSAKQILKTFSTLPATETKCQTDRGSNQLLDRVENLELFS